MEALVRLFKGARSVYTKRNIRAQQFPAPNVTPDTQHPLPILNLFPEVIVERTTT